jgi:tetratricopeptide (TPR) repeat protein
VAAELRSRLERLLATAHGTGRTAATKLDEESRQRLAALGYLLPAGSDPEAITEELHDEGIAPQDRVGDVNDLSAAKSLLFHRRPLEARELLLSLLARDPDNGLYRELLTGAELQLGMVKQALADFEILRGPHGTKAVTESLLHQLVTVLFSEGRRDRALRLLEDHLAKAATADGEYLLATLRGQLGDQDGKRAALLKALELDPTHVPARIDLAVLLAETGSPEAEAQLQQAVQNGRYSSRAHFNYGAFLAKQGELERAAGLLERAVELNPRYLQAHLAIVAVALDLGDRARAERAFDRMQRISRDSDEVRQAAQLLAGEAH